MDRQAPGKRVQVHRSLAIGRDGPAPWRESVLDQARNQRNRSPDAVAFGEMLVGNQVLHAGEMQEIGLESYNFV